MRAMEAADPPTPEGLDVRTYFVRERNALLARADFGELYVDYYLHQGHTVIIMPRSTMAC